MKKLLVLTTFLAATSIASADQITFGCGQITAPVPPAAGSGPSACAGFTGVNAIPVGATINFVKLTYGVDFSFNPTIQPAPSVTFGFDAPGVLFDTAGIVVTQASRPTNGSIQRNGVAATTGLTSAFNVIGSWSANNPPVTSVVMDFNFTADYTPASGVPEPSTFALIGFALLSVGWAGRRHKS